MRRLATSLAAIFLILVAIISLQVITTGHHTGHKDDYRRLLPTETIAKTITITADYDPAADANFSRLPLDVPGGRRYVLADSYWEQMTRATINLFDLVKFATDWRASVPVPFLVDTFPKGFPSHGTAKRSLQEPSLSFLFDMDGVRREMRKRGLTPFVDSDQFLLDFCGPVGSNYKNTFIVTIDFLPCTYKDPEPRCDLHHVAKVPCTEVDKRLVRHAYSTCSRPELSKTYWEKYGSSVTCCSVCGLIPTLPSNISIGCGFHGLPEFTVIFKQWRGIMSGKSFRMLAPLHYIKHHKSPSPVLPHSWFVESKTTEFINHVIGGDSKDFLAVHLRTEKIHIAMKANGTQCILDAITKAHNVSQTTGIKHIMYFADEFAMMYYRDVFISNNIEITKYDPKVFHLQPDNAGIIAQIEQNIASRGAGLIITGGGSFQYVIKRRYLMKVDESHRLLYELPCPPYTGQ